MEFGILKKESQREVKVEKYDYPVLTLLQKPSKGEAHKIEFNKAALTVLGFTGVGGNVGFATNKETGVTYMKSVVKGYSVGKVSCCISNKELCEILCIKYDVDNTDKAIEFKLESEDTAFKLLLLVDHIETEENATEEEVLEEETIIHSVNV